MKKLLLIIFVLISLFSSAQSIILGDSLKIEIKEVSIIKTTSVNVNESTQKTKFIKDKSMHVFCQLESLNNEPIDINAFSLINTKSKLRFRIIRYRGWKGTSTIGFGHDNKSYLKEELLNSKGKPFKSIPKYNSSIKDSFEKFKFEGYTIIEVPRYFTSLNKNLANVILSRKRNLASVIYYPYSKFKKVLASFTFPCLDTKNTKSYNLYYGEAFISKIDFEN